MLGFNTVTSSLIKFAMGLYDNSLSSSAMIRSRHPRLGKLIMAIAPFIMLGATTVSLFRKNRFITWLVGRICNTFMATITVPDNHPLLPELTKRLSAQGMKANARQMTLKQERKGQSLLRQLEGSMDGGSKKDKADLLECQHDGGIFSYRYKGRLFRFDVHQKPKEEKNQKNDEEHSPLLSALTASDGAQVSISCFSIGAGTRPVLDFLKPIESLHLAQKQFRTTICQASWGGKYSWQFAEKLPLVKDIESYFSKETELFYTSRGIPLRRGYLLYGPPGTGKTSFSASIARHFSLMLFVINLNTPELDDNGLRTLFAQFPHRCVVLLEDIDSAGIKRDNMCDASGGQHDKNKSKATVTLSGLFNVLDGPASSEGRLVLMTTNAPESLDPALVRPGRVDMKVRLGNACTEVLAKMFKRIFAHDSKEGSEAEADIHDKYIEKLANSFACSVPSKMLTPAEVQCFLMTHRDDPEQAVAKAEQWAAELIETKSSGKNVCNPTVVGTPADVEQDAEEGDDGESRDGELLTPPRHSRSKRSDASSKKARTKSRKQTRAAISVERGY